MRDINVKKHVISILRFLKRYLFQHHFTMTENTDKVLTSMGERFQMHFDEITPEY